MRILIADDDEISRSLVADILRTPDVEIVEVPDGAQVVSLLSSSPSPVNPLFDLLVTDYVMPWMNGLQLAATLRAHGSEVPILIMTGMTTPDVDTRVARLSGVALLRKPFDIAQLRAAVERLLDRNATRSSGRGARAARNTPR